MLFVSYSFRGSVEEGGAREHGLGIKTRSSLRWCKAMTLYYSETAFPDIKMMFTSAFMSRCLCTRTCLFPSMPVTLP